MLHVAVLLVLPVLQEAQRVLRPAPPPLTARLARPAPSEPASPKIEPPAKPPPRPLAPGRADIAMAAPARAVSPPRVSLPVPSVEPAKPPAETAVPVPELPAVPPAVAAQAPAAGAPDPAAVAQFRLELMDLARRYKKYPRLAQDNDWEGRVELRIAIGENGAISSITVKKGAAHAVLDDEAQTMLRTAKSKLTIPPGLRGRAFTLDIAVDFFLKNEQ